MQRDGLSKQGASSLPDELSRALATMDQLAKKF